MKRQFGKTMHRIGDVAGVGADLTDSNVLNLSSTGSLVLVKTAFLTTGGAQLSNNDTVPAGTSVDFMIYINNESSVAINDVTIQDVLNVAFTYTAGTIRIDNSVADCGASCTPAQEQAIYAVAAATAPLLDTIELGDTASNTGVNIDAGDENVGNGQLDIAANTVLALVFTVVVP